MKSKVVFLRKIVKNSDDEGSTFKQELLPDSVAHLDWCLSISQALVTMACTT